jgi:hypothetical protein
VDEEEVLVAYATNAMSPTTICSIRNGIYKRFFYLCESVSPVLFSLKHTGDVAAITEPTFNAHRYPFAFYATAIPQNLTLSSEY